VRWHKAALLMPVLLLVSLLAACGASSNSTTANSTAAPGAAAAATAPAAAATTGGEKTKIRLAIWAGVDEAKELQAVIDTINAKATTFEIVQEAQPADYYTKLQTNLAGGTAADLLWLSQEYIAGYAQKGVLLDISDRLAADDRPAAKLDDYYPSVLQTAQYQNKTYGLPWIAQPVMLYYNPKLFADAGVELPNDNWTWDDFKTAAATLTKDTNGDGKADQFGTAFNGWPPIQMFIWQAGGEVISEDKTTSPIDSPEALAGAAFYSDIIYNPKYAATEDVIKEQGFGELAKNGKVAMFYGGAGDDLDYAHAKDPKFAELKIALVPKGPKSRATFAWTASTVINAATKNPDQAYDALVELTDGIQHWKIVAPRKSLATAEVINTSVPQKQPSAEMILKALPDARSFRIVPKQSDWDKAYFDQFQDPLFHKKGTIEELTKQVMPDLEAALAP
ncbi:MAG TPA: sugar ABC transporter substrate-binding protein, partial [Roseiflexaceae bacterium]|nr:sugar ABC transporter substrate-binding protein [Roseiflexaceae bacterium]